MPGHGDHVVAAHDERPRFALRSGDLRVDEHVLDLLLPPGEPVAGPPASYLKPFELGADAPLAPADLAVEVDRPALEPEPVVLAHRLDGRRRGRRASSPTGDASSSASAGGSVSRRSSARRMFASAAGWRRRRSGRISSRIRPRFVSALLESIAERQPCGLGSTSTVSSRQTASSGRTTPSARRGADPGRAAARDEPVEDRLDLVRGRVPGRAQPVGGRPSSAARGARPRSGPRRRARRPRRRARRGRSGRPPRTPRRAACGSRAARRRGSRARGARARGRSSRRRPRRGSRSRRPARSARAGGCAPRSARAAPRSPRGRLSPIAS